MYADDETTQGAHDEEHFSGETIGDDVIDEFDEADHAGDEDELHAHHHEDEEEDGIFDFYGHDDEEEKKDWNY